jgi:hypothetical protein
LRRKIFGVAAAAALALTALVAGSALADHAPVNDAVAHAETRACADQPADDAGYGARDGWDHWHLSNPAVVHSLAEAEGYLNVCHTFDSLAVERVGASARAVRVSGVNRVQLRAQLQKFVGGAWVTINSSLSVNTGDNRTLTVSTPISNSPDTVPGWFRSNVRYLYRSSNGQLTFVQRQTYPTWLGDGPVALPVPV